MRLFAFSQGFFSFFPPHYSPNQPEETLPQHTECVLLVSVVCCGFRQSQKGTRGKMKKGAELPSLSSSVRPSQLSRAVHLSVAFNNSCTFPAAPEMSLGQFSGVNSWRESGVLDTPGGEKSEDEKFVMRCVWVGGESRFCEEISEWDALTEGWQKCFRRRSLGVRSGLVSCVSFICFAVFVLSYLSRQMCNICMRLLACMHLGGGGGGIKCVYVCACMYVSVFI